MKAHSIKRFLNNNLTKVIKPIQYVGNEINSICKKWSKNVTKVCYIFPDKYEIGMSNLALQIFYNRINHHTKHILERAFIPDDDMVTLMQESDISLFSLESKRAIAEFDAVAFSIPSELNFTNVLYALDLAKLPMQSKERLENDALPLVFAGGGGIVNPLPMSRFMDFFVMGDGEVNLENVLDIIYNTRIKQNLTKIEVLSALNDLPSVYVPILHNPDKKVVLHKFKDFDTTGLLKPLIPLLKPIQNKFSIEIMRGCPRSCRFCQASHLSRPVRLVPEKQVLEQANHIITSSGYDEISLTSLSSSDHPQILSIISNLEEICEAKQVQLSLPSLRVDTFNKEVSVSINKIRQSGLTIAPEAGSQFLRDVIKKDLDEEQIRNAVITAVKNTNKGIKLYFMLGLPLEEMDDIKAIVDLAFTLISDIKPARNKIVVNVSNFTPKPFTPLQWARQNNREELEEKLMYLKRNLRHPQLELRWTDPEVSIVEGILSRGDEKVGELILEAYQAGAKFDAWYDKFDFEYWTKATEKTGISFDKYQASQNVEEDPPWHMIVETGINIDKLRAEYRQTLDIKR